MYLILVGWNSDVRPLFLPKAKILVSNTITDHCMKYNSDHYVRKTFISVVIILCGIRLTIICPHLLFHISGGM